VDGKAANTVAQWNSVDSLPAPRKRVKDMDSPDRELELVSRLIDLKREGGHWDYKAKWPQGASLLHDIICMANNLEDEDGYIIIGVDESRNFSLADVSQDENRRDTNRLNTFLRDKKFLGDMRPMVSSSTYEFDNKQIDVIRIENSNHTPYILAKDFTDARHNGTIPKTVRANHVYTRVQDTNTPIDKSADIDKVEYLWRKRFGLDKSALQRLDAILSEPDDWVYDDQRAMFYYKYAPEFVIQIANTRYAENGDYRDRTAFYCELYAGGDRYYWENYEVKYHNTVIHEWVCVYLDGGRYLITIPESSIISMGYDSLNDKYTILYSYDLSALDGKIDRIFLAHYPGENRRDISPIARDIIEFSSSSQKKEFVKYLEANYTAFPELITLEQLRETFENSDDPDDWTKVYEHWERQTMTAPKASLAIGVRLDFNRYATMSLTSSHNVSWLSNC